MSLHTMTYRVTGKESVCAVHVGSGVRNHLREILNGRYTGVCVVIDSTVRHRYGEELLGIIKGAGLPVIEVTLRAGESYKTLESVRHIYTALMSLKMDRGSVVVAVGGGTISDTAGFAAATYMRGIDFIAVPTTLLGQVDAGIGGKTGVNFDGIKNIIGSFHHPKAIIADTDTLSSLPEKEIEAGMAEVIKYGFIMDSGLIKQLATHPPIAKKSPHLTDIIKRCIEHKIRVVTDDPNDTDIRALLNFGHTIGHAIEKVSRRYNHGQAIAIGMVGACMISENIQGLPKAATNKLEQVLTKYHLPTHAPGLNTKELLDTMKTDKKSHHGQIQWVLLDRIGHAVYGQNVPNELVTSVVEKLTTMS